MDIFWAIILSVIVVMAVAVVVLVVSLKFLKQQTSLFEQKNREEMKFAQEQLILLAKQQFQAEQNKAVTELETRKQAVESTVKGLKEQLENYQKLMRDFEQDRTRKYGNLETELKNASLATTKLQDTTNRLNNILGNVKLRGQWGERMAEDIIRISGLIEGINYKKQTQMELATTKPDYTFLLPNSHTINMDVKFPLDNYLNMVNAENPLQREQYLKEFNKNVNMRIKEIQNRAYINPSENTLDFVLLFIPNEQVFSFIQESIPGLMDEALKQKVVLCSPFTLYAMLSVVRQAYENFRYEKATKEIVNLIEQFTKTYETFKVRFDEIGKSIERLESQYSDIKDKSFKNLDVKIRRIGDYKKGNTVSLDKKDAPLEIPLDEYQDEEVRQKM